MDKIEKMEIDGKQYYKGLDVTKSLGYARGRTAISDHISEENKRKVKGTYFLDESGVKTLILKCKLPNAIDVAKAMNIDISNHKVLFKEQCTVNSIQKAFKTETIELQKKVDRYRIDVYFPDYNLAIECDEFGHVQRNQEEEKERQKYLEKKLSCTFIRYNPDDSKFDVLDVISDIHNFMMKHKKK